MMLLAGKAYERGAMSDIYDEAATNAIKLVKDILDKHGPRVSGTTSNYASVDELERIVKETCSSTRREKFAIHPNSLFSIGRIFGAMYIIGLLASLTNNSILAVFVGTACMAFGIVFCVSQFILYSDLFDRLFKKVEGNNIVGYVEPEGEVKEQIVLVGHHDSSYIYPFHETLPRLFPIRLFVPIIMFLFEFLVLTIALLGGFKPGIPMWTKYVSLTGLLFVVPMFGYISRKPGPGAGDNLIGCAIGINILELLNKDCRKLKHTRLVLLLTDGEEVGQKGARYFVTRNMEELKKISTKVITIDSIYKKCDTTLLRSDRNGFSKLSSNLVESLMRVAEQRGYHPRIRQMPFGGGGTDGGQFARKGIETVSIIGMPTDVIRKEIIIHTKNDLPERIDMDAVSLVLEIVSEYIKANDKALE